MTIERKDTNPKDAIAGNKAPLGLFPDSAVVAGSLAFFEGALKYGRYNWRTASVRASVYVDAARRHLAQFWNGENIDPDSGLPHLWKALACVAILIDSIEIQNMVDDRPPPAPVKAMLDRVQEHARALRERLGPGVLQPTITDPDPEDDDGSPKVYVAGRFQSYEKVRGMIDALASRGFTITYDWTRTSEFDASGQPLPNTEDTSKDKLRSYAENDLRGVKDADFLVLLADDSLAGAWVEMGAALAQGKPVHVIAPERWTIFLECEGVFQYASAAEFLDAVGSEAAVERGG